jgi:CheY-like chemotaxis protein
MPYRSVLVVDDDPDVRCTLASALRFRFVITDATDGIDALAKIDGGAEFDAILCDYRMPAMDGLAFVLELRARGDRHARRVLVYSGNTTVVEIEAARVGLAVRLLAKRAELDDIVAELERVIAAG